MLCRTYPNRLHDIVCSLILNDNENENDLHDSIAKPDSHCYVTCRLGGATCGLRPESSKVYNKLLHLGQFEPTDIEAAIHHTSLQPLSTGNQIAQPF